MTPQTGVEPGLGYRCPWYHASLLLNESSYLAVEDYGCVPETHGTATYLDGHLRSDHAFNCVESGPSMANACVRGQYPVFRCSWRFWVTGQLRILWNFSHRRVRYFLQYSNYALS